MSINRYLYFFGKLYNRYLFGKISKDLYDQQTKMLEEIYTKKFL